MPDSPSVDAALHVQLRHRIGTLKIDVDFRIRESWAVLFGPSGSGKTTILRAIAGLIRPDLGRIVSWRASSETKTQETVLNDTDKGIFVPPHRRAMPFVFQRPTLFPHMTVAANLGFGSSGDAVRAKERTSELIDIFRIADHMAKYPAQLSGGEAQRVCLARAFAGSPKRLVLLDEAFTGLDTELRDQIVRDLLVWRQTHTLPVLSVSHDVGEAFLLGAEVLRLEDGKIAQQGPVEQVLAPERQRLLRQLVS